MIAYGRSDVLVQGELACNPMGVSSQHVRIGSRGAQAGTGGPWLYKFSGPPEGIAQIPTLFPAITMFPGLEVSAVDLEQNHADWLAAQGVPVESDPRRLINLLRTVRDSSGESYSTFDISSGE